MHYTINIFTDIDITLIPINRHFRWSRLHFKNFEVPGKKENKILEVGFFYLGICNRQRHSSVSESGPVFDPAFP